MSDVKRCAACRQEKPVSEMKICMHNQMHRYVCDMKCMNDFYNPPNAPATQGLKPEIAALAADNKRLREALTDLLGCPAQVVQATVPRAGIEAAPPYQVVLDVSVSLTRWNKAKAALAGSKDGDL